MSTKNDFTTFSNKQITNRQLIIRITVVLFIGSLLVGVFFSFYLKSIALNTLAQQDAKRTSELIFEVMYTKMQEGWSKEDLATIIKRLNKVKKGLNIHSYRSPQVATLFGTDIQTNQALKTDPMLRKAMQNGQEQLHIAKDDSIRFYYPVKVQKQCLTCHTNTQVGDVNGVIDIYFPSNEIAIPLYMIIAYFIIFLILFLFVVFIIFYLILNKKIVTPLVSFTGQMKSIIADGNLKKRILIKSNITEIRQLDFEFNNLLEQIQYYYEQLISQFYIDQLTSLPNLSALNRDIEKTSTPSLVIFNINQFKNINNFYGYDAGDYILTKLAELLNNYASNKNIYRISSDEFAWLTDEMVNFYDLLEMLEELEEYPFMYKKSEIHLNLSCGIAESKERIIENAMSALDIAKVKSKPFEVYDNAMKTYTDIEDNIYWTQQLRDALKEDRIIIYFQPILDVHYTKANKFETLVRLQGEDGTIYSPIKFMQAAKLSRLYLRLTRVIMKKAFEYFKDKPYEFSVNVSIDDIVDGPTRNYIMDLLRYFPEPFRVVFEILETEEITEFEIINKFAQDVHKYGAKLAIDDFGSGYSNYDNVIKLNVDFLKIDSSLIKYIDKDKQTTAVVTSIINVSNELGLKTIAEYVHSKEVMDKVIELGVDYVQGYYIDEPLKCVKLHTEK